MDSNRKIVMIAGVLFIIGIKPGIHKRWNHRSIIFSYFWQFIADRS